MGEEFEFYVLVFDDMVEMMFVLCEDVKLNCIEEY